VAAGIGLQSTSVDEHSRQDVARKAGVEPAYVDRLVDLGFLTPGAEGGFSTGDVRRARWVRSFEDSGVPLDGLAAAVREGVLSFSYLDAAAFDRFAGLSATTFRELSERTGVSLTLLQVIREAFGYAEPAPDDPMLEDELSVASVIELQVANGFRPVVIERWLRGYADNLRRVAEMETDWWRSEVEEPLLRGGMTETQMLEAQAEVGSVMTPLMEQAIVAIYRGQQEHAWTKTAVEDVEGALEKAGLYRRPHRSPAVCFLDITGYTRLTEERGDEAAAEIATRLATLVRRSSREHGGQPVKWLGDGVMFYFPEPAPSVMAALDMVAGVAAHDLPPAHVGIHTGPVVVQDGDYFGRTVNIASRIADYARPGEVLVTHEIVEVADRIPVTFTDVGPVELKGVSGTLRLHSARRVG
jgi:adenylate cyclase